MFNLIRWKFFDRLDETRQAIDSVVLKNIQNSQKRNERCYDQRHSTGTKICIGDKVLKQIPRLAKKKGKKGKVQWEGPLRVIRMNDRGNPIVRNVDREGGTICVPIRQLKYYKSCGINVKLNETYIERIDNEDRMDIVKKESEGCIDGNVDLEENSYSNLEEWESPDIVDSVMESDDMLMVLRFCTLKQD